MSVSIIDYAFSVSCLNFYVFFYCVPLASDMWPELLVLTRSFMTCWVQYFLFGLSYVCSCKVLSYYCYLYELFLTCLTSFIILDFNIRDLIFTRCAILWRINDQFFRGNLLLSLLVQIVFTSLCLYVSHFCSSLYLGLRSLFGVPFLYQVFWYFLFLISYWRMHVLRTRRSSI